MKTAILTDSNSGIFEDEAKELGIFTIPMPIMIDSKEYFEGKNISSKEFYEMLIHSHKITTSQPSMGMVIEMVHYILAKGFDEVVYIPMSSGLSGSCQSANLLVDNFQGKLFVVDNHRISVTLRQSVLNAKKLADENIEGYMIKDMLEKNADHSIIFVGVETLEYLKRSGRVTKAGAAISTLMHIKPLLVINGDKLDGYGKARGTNKCRELLIKAVKEKVEEFKNQNIKISIGVAGSFLNKEDDLKWLMQVKNAFPDEDIFYDPLTLSIASHVGINAFGVGISKKL